MFGQDVEIDIELAPGDQTSTPRTKELPEKDIGNQLHMLTNRHDKFLDTLREVKVRVQRGGCRGLWEVRVRVQRGGLGGLQEVKVHVWCRGVC